MTHKVTSGDPVNFPASEFNTMLDVNQAHRQRQSFQTPPAAGRITDNVPVKNNSGVDVARFGILGIDGILFSPTDNLQEFQNNFALKGITPAAGHVGNFVIMQTPVANGRIGRGVVCGCTPVQVNVLETTHGFAEIKDTDATQLESAASGSAQIIYKESGIGTKWALIRFAGGVGVEQQQVITDFRVNGTTLQVKTRTVDIIPVDGQSESGWTTIHTGTTCT